MGGDTRPWSDVRVPEVLGTHLEAEGRLLLVEEEVPDAGQCLLTNLDP